MTDVANASRRRRAAGRPEAGITVVELILALAMTAILAGAITYAFTAGIQMHRRHTQDLAKTDTTAHMEEELTRLFEGARLSTATAGTRAVASVNTTNGPTTYFTSETNGTSTDLGCDRVTFTTTGAGIPMSTFYSDDDYETQQTARGPIGGLAEVSLGTTAVGDSGDKTGLFERIQRPSDTDTTQGGKEFVLDPAIESMGFQFYDGTQWESAWDTTSGVARLPQAVQISYTIKDDPDQTTHVFVVTIPASDVNSLDPYSSTTTGS
ncbi:MAG: hypothetical protein P4L33_01990 [Capsulimonadaceae bacterium]|nr:hypothetical protein [Capsulimonadaceae bacterium]